MVELKYRHRRLSNPERIDFSEIFKDSKFIIEEIEEETIDLEKDKEYYNFKHK